MNHITPLLFELQWLPIKVRTSHESSHSTETAVQKVLANILRAFDIANTFELIRVFYVQLLTITLLK